MERPSSPLSGSQSWILYGRRNRRDRAGARTRPAAPPAAPPRSAATAGRPPPAARKLQARCGLVCVEGGRHPDWGTANRIVPSGTSYLELVDDGDHEAAAHSSFGRWVATGASSGPAAWLGAAHRTTPGPMPGCGSAADRAATGLASGSGRYSALARSFDFELP